MRQINFGLIFAFGLAMVFFTLENTSATTVHILLRLATPKRHAKATRSASTSTPPAISSCSMPAHAGMSRTSY